MKKNILILGGSSPQYSAIQACLDLNYNFVVFDGNNDCLASKLLSNKRFKKVDISCPNDVIKEIRKLPFKIDACVTTQTDIGISSLAEVNKMFGLVGLLPKHAEIVVDKYKMALACKSAKIKHPNTVLLKNYKSLKNYVNSVNYIVKPSDSSGSKGITLLNTLEKLNASKLKSIYNHAKANSNQGKVILQKFINGIEFGAQFFYLKKQKSFFIVHDDQMGGKNNNIPIGHSMPSFLNKEIKKKCESIILKFLKSNDLPEGPYNIDFIKTRNTIYLLEIAARVGATGLQELSELYLNFNPIKQQIKLCLGQKVLQRKTKNNRPCISRMLFSEKNGTCSLIKHPKIKLLENEFSVKVNYFKIEIKIGDKLKGFNSGRDRVGYLILSSKNINNCFNAIKAFENGISIR